MSEKNGESKGSVGKKKRGPRQVRFSPSDQVEWQAISDETKKLLRPTFLACTFIICFALLSLLAGIVLMLFYTVSIFFCIFMVVIGLGGLIHGVVWVKRQMEEVGKTPVGKELVERSQALFARYGIKIDEPFKIVK